MAASIANSESILFAINPQMSYVPKEWIAADPAFWEPKPVKPAQSPRQTPAPKPKRSRRQMSAGNC